MLKALVLTVKFVASNFNEFLAKNGPYMSAAIAYYAFFSLFPLSLALIAVFSLFLGIEGFEDQLITGLQEQIPVLAELSETEDDFLKNFFDSIKGGRVAGGVVATLGLFWVSQQVFSAIRKSINVIWGINKTRPFLTERLMDIALMFGAATLLFASLLITAGITFIQDLSAIWLPDAPISDPALWQRFAVFIPLVLTFTVFLTLYWWLPNTKLRFKEVWPTALAGAAAFEISKAIFVFYLRNMSGVATSIYGGVSAIIVLMIFVYVSAIILLVGAMLTSRYAFYLAETEQKKRNRSLSRSLERIRGTASLPGMPNPVPTGAQEPEFAERPGAMRNPDSIRSDRSE
ncbi:YihY/virulence factor BrkB family protein [Candidatus Lucifugimonas marina]|uniref:YihY family inner membrane protein n=1 Tax=Candidatus Lucifugimonas marina TaxID=3038979 RepID=A0AAJ6CQH2_9CHLR|nr:YihY family inner membrane protein [SAR202 cluster bacterium JH702]MDG0869669.1 YihY family inner membrane protein [SAR202 cluster bacterium JH639]WFG34402.1 YihY family inner membrane protein [SAR202 cluster bacterium JH545]WFG38331.1 YihY family inner membrane protein [SAR202 cluster bacterium JH1073]